MLNNAIHLPNGMLGRTTKLKPEKMLHIYERDPNDLENDRQVYIIPLNLPHFEHLQEFSKHFQHLLSSQESFNKIKVY